MNMSDPVRVNQSFDQWIDWMHKYPQAAKELFDTAHLRQGEHRQPLNQGLVGNLKEKWDRLDPAHRDKITDAEAVKGLREVTERYIRNTPHETQAIKPLRSHDREVQAELQKYAPPQNGQERSETVKNGQVPAWAKNPDAYQRGLEKLVSAYEKGGNKEVQRHLEQRQQQQQQRRQTQVQHSNGMSATQMAYSRPFQRQNGVDPSPTKLVHKAIKQHI